ncbi:MAG TPA: hypothetical protein VGA37_17245 [Gemmatimonadales bacterium]
MRTGGDRPLVLVPALKRRLGTCGDGCGSTPAPAPFTARRRDSAAEPGFQARNRDRTYDR